MDYLLKDAVRAIGYYWVKLQEEDDYEPALWTPYSYWFIIGSDRQWKSVEFYDIDENIITRNADRF